MLAMHMLPHHLRHLLHTPVTGPEALGARHAARRGRNFDQECAKGPCVPAVAGLDFSEGEGTAGAGA